MQRRLEAIKASRWQVRYNLREVHKVTQWKAGCVYRTKSLGMIVCAPDYQLLGQADTPGLTIGSVSTAVSRMLS
jgi:hypothetical protein